MDEDIRAEDGEPTVTVPAVSIGPGVVLPGAVGPGGDIGDTIPVDRLTYAQETTSAVVDRAAGVVGDIYSIISGRQQELSDAHASIRSDGNSAAQVAVNSAGTKYNAIRDYVAKKCGERIMALSANVIDVINALSPLPGGDHQGPCLPDPYQWPEGNGPNHVLDYHDGPFSGFQFWTTQIWPSHPPAPMCSAQMHYHGDTFYPTINADRQATIDLAGSQQGCTTQRQYEIGRSGDSLYCHGLPPVYGRYELKNTEGGRWGWFCGDPKNMAHQGPDYMFRSIACTEPVECRGDDCPPPGPGPSPIPPPPPPVEPPPPAACGVCPTDPGDVPIGDEDLPFVGPACSPSDAKSFVENVANLAPPPALSDQFGFKEGKSPESLGEYLNAAAGELIGKRFFSGVANYAIDVLGKFSDHWQIIAGCTNAGLQSSFQLWSSVAFASKYLGSFPNIVMARIEQAMNANCQYIIPSPPELNALCIRDYISTGEWEAATKMHGVCVPWAEKIKEMNETRVDPIQTVMAWRRELLNDDEKDTFLTRLGVQSSKQKELVEKLTLQYPGMSDLVRMMVRDVDDRTVVGDEDLDHDFGKKWIDKLKQWGKFQGVDDEIAKYYWRAHWQYPSNTQLYDMVHRLRKERPKHGGPFDAEDVTLDDAKKLLEINDTAPKWVNRLLAISYRPYTRVDIRRMHCQGILTDAEVYEAYRDLGYDDDRAKCLRDFTVKLNAAGSCAGVVGITPKEVVALYRKDAVQRAEAESLLLSTGMTQDDADTMLTGAEYKRDADRRVKTIEMMRRRFMLGDIDGRDLDSELQQIGLDAMQASNLAKHWLNALRYKRKEGTAAVLCEWFQRGLMSIDVFADRLSRMGWFQDDIRRIIETCFLKLLDKQQAAAKKKVSEIEDASKVAAKAAAKAKAQTAAARAANPMTNGTYKRRFGDSGNGTLVSDTDGNSPP